MSSQDNQTFQAWRSLSYLMSNRKDTYNYKTLKVPYSIFLVIKYHIQQLMIFISFSIDMIEIKMQK